MKKIASIFMTSVFALGIIPIASVFSENTYAINVSSYETTNTITNTTDHGFYYNEIEEGIEIIGGDASITGDVVIPDNINGLPVVRISSMPSWDNKDFISLTIPSSVKEIGEFAFAEQKELKTINFYAGLEKIDAGAFSNSGITILNLPNTVKYIGASAFYACSELSEITLSDNLEFIGMNCFSNCKASEKTSDGPVIIDGWFIKYETLNDKAPQTLTIPEGVIGIAEQHYYDNANGVENNTIKIIIPSSTKTISDNAFSEYKFLEQIIVSENNPYLCDINGVLYSKDKTQLIRYPIAYPITNFTFPDSVKITSSYAFRGCTKLESIKMNNNLSELGGATFAFCENLTSVKFSDKIKKLNSQEFIVSYGGKGTSGVHGMFWSCNSLTEITIPKNIDYIGGSSFSLCNNLKKVVVENPDCIIEEGRYVTSFSEAILYGYENSTLQSYAQNYKYDFIKIETPSIKVSTNLGDFNDDNIIDGRDATDILTLYAKSSAGGRTATVEEIKKGDATKDDIIDGRDATAVLTYYAKISAGNKVTFEEFLNSIRN